jgi:signal transduction histidine kinase/ligand-binding sensor domain-containing protein
MRVPRTVYWYSSILFLGLVARNGLALDPNKRITQYRHNAWRVQDGLLPNGPEWISQTADGYLLVGSRAIGAYQFDGTRFLPSPAPVSVVSRLSQINARGGGFWVSEERGVTHFIETRVIAHFDLHGTPYHMVEDADGSVWVILTGRRGAAGSLCHVTDTTARCLGEAEGIAFDRADAILPDGKGGFWIGTSTSLVHWNSGHSTTFECKALRSNAGQDGIVSLVPNADGSLWVGMQAIGPGLGLEKFIVDHFEPLIVRDSNGSKVVVDALLKDRDQNLWLGTSQGIYRIHGETVDHFGTADGLSGDSVAAIYEDKEGIIWAATSNGLDSFRDRRIVTFSQAEGLSGGEVQSVLASRDGTIWAGNETSLDYLKDGVIVSIRAGEGLPGHQVASLLEDRAGRIWVGIDDGLFLYQNRRFLRLPEPNHRPLGLVVGIAEDVEGNIWAECGSNPRKLVRIRDFRVQEEFLSSQVPRAHSIAADPRGGIWLGALNGDLVHFQHGSVTIFPTHFTGENARQIEAEPDGTVLAAAPNDGLIGLRLGKIQRLTRSNGLPCDGVFAFVQDNEKNWWLETPCGYAMLADSEMQRWWIHPNTLVQYRFFDVSDGARTRTVSFNPSAKSLDGRLWFANWSLQSIDPRHLQFNRVPPPVHIEQITADHKAYQIDSAASGNLRLPPLVRDLEIDYTALSLVAPEKNLFRVKLEGWDPDWIDAGNERKAFYGNLPARNYRFRVAASNNSGVWNEAGASLNFSIDPAYYQTRWFQASCAVVGMALLWGMYRYRLHQVAREYDVRLQEREGERSRLARDLHDTLLQSFHGLMLRFQTVNKLLPEGKAKEQLEITLELADRAIAEGRGAVYDLRLSATATNDLAEAVNAVGNELCKDAAAAFNLTVEGTVRDLHPIIRDELYRISREALSNACKHAHAQHIEAEISYGDRAFRLRIRDDGEGIPTEVLDQGRAGHFGLAGIRERAKRIGAELTIWSRPGTGTEIDLSLAGTIAYGTSPRRSRFRLFHRRETRSDSSVDSRRSSTPS